jgi:4-hydroxy 2-oxovalerate aldolase
VIKKKKIEILDCTLRDGSYVLNYNFTDFETSLISKLLYESGINFVEVGHGVGLGASKKIFSSFCSDEKYIEAANLAKKNNQNKVGSFCFSNIASKDKINSAFKAGLDFIRFGVDPETFKKDLNLIRYSKNLGLEVYINFIKSYNYSPKKISNLSRIFEQEGIEGVYIVDSAGGMMPNDVKKYVLAISNKIRTKNFRVGFHGHNNLGLANANCISAIEAGATLVDSSLMGMGRSSGNAITEMLVPILQREGKIRKNINVSILFNLIKKVINPIYKKSSFDENEILIGKSYFHSSNFDELKKLAVKLNVKTSKILQNISFKKNSNLDEKLKKKIRLKFKKFKKEKKTNLQNIYNNIEYVNVNSIKNINNLKKILISEKFKKKSEMAITICRGNTNHLKIKNIYSTDNIILGHLESPNKILDKLIIRNFSDYFIFLDEKIKLEKDNRFKKLNIFSYSEEKIFIDAIFDFINALNYSRILTNVKKFKYLENNYKGNKKNKNLVIFEDNLKKSDIFLKKIKTEFDILLVNILKRDVSEIKRKNSYLARIFKPNYGLTLCHDILRKIDSIKNLQTTFDIEYMDKNTKIAAGGQIAEKNSIIVNNIKNPTKIIGISDGKGGLLDVDFENQKKKKINNWFINKIIN